MKKVENKKAQKTLTEGRVLIVISIAMAALFGIQAVDNINEIDSKLVGDSMLDAASDMEDIKSVSGNSINESYYQAQGQYLVGEAKVYNAQIWFQKRTAIAVDMLGIMACVVLFLYGKNRIAVAKD